MTGKKVPAYKKESTNLIKIIGQLVFFLSSVKSLNYFMENKIFTEYQSGFIPGDSCVAQLLSIYT